MIPDTGIRVLRDAGCMDEMLDEALAHSEAA